MTASDFDHAYGFLLTRGRSPYMRRLAGAKLRVGGDELLGGRHVPLQTFLISVPTSYDPLAAQRQFHRKEP